MASFLVSNIHNRKHATIYRELGQGAIFDLSESQDGWDAFNRIREGDEVFVINVNKNVAVAYVVTLVKKGIQLDSSAVGIAAETGGQTGVIFGKPIRRVDQEYSTFVLKHGIRDSRLSPKSGLMYQGFNCAEF